MIKTQDLSKNFDGFRAVEGVNLDVQPGQVLALLGPNGAGKTTTIRMLTSILVPSRGWAQVAGYDVVRQSDRVRATVGVLTEQHGLYGRMPADDYLNFFGEIYNIPARQRKESIDRLLETFGLQADRRRRVGEYSKGMRQKLALARALLHEPRVLLLDEPTSAMDPESARLVRNSIQDLRREDRTILICTHNLGEAEELADQIAIIRRGQIIACGSTADLKAALLGPLEYDVRLGEPLNGHSVQLPAGAELTGTGVDWFRFRPDQPQIDNPLILRSLLDQGLAVLSVQEAPRSLEQVYLQAIAMEETMTPFGQESRHVG